MWSERICNFLSFSAITMWCLAATIIKVTWVLWKQRSKNFWQSSQKRAGFWFAFCRIDFKVHCLIRAVIVPLLYSPFLGDEQSCFQIKRSRNFSYQPSFIGMIFFHKMKAAKAKNYERAQVQGWACYRCTGFGFKRSKWRCINSIAMIFWKNNLLCAQLHFVLKYECSCFHHRC